MSDQAFRHGRLRRNPRYQDGCSNKRRFRNEDHAKDAIRRIRYLKAIQEGEDTAGPIPIREYFCLNCSGFHLTSQIQGRDPYRFYGFRPEATSL